MILIADSGATKTDWCLGKNKADAQVVQTQGINPFHQSKEHIAQVLIEELLPQLPTDEHITHIHFYGAGCTPEKSLIVKEELAKLFPDAIIDVQSDLLGAARALCGKEKGIACILGTGSNSCEFNGKEIVRNTPSLGYILGDEGSGASLGRILIGDWLKGQLPTALGDAFAHEYNLTQNDIIERVYRQPLANRFLANFTPFLHKHRTEPTIHTLLVGEFTRFFLRNVMTYDTTLPIHFVGSIAHYFSEELTEAAQSLDLTIGRILRAPMEGLVKCINQ